MKKPLEDVSNALGRLFENQLLKMPRNGSGGYNAFTL